jgi:hypothetical protein
VPLPPGQRAVSARLLQPLPDQHRSLIHAATASPAAAEEEGGGCHHRCQRECEAPSPALALPLAPPVPARQCVCARSIARRAPPSSLQRAGQSSAAACEALPR